MRKNDDGVISRKRLIFIIIGLILTIICIVGGLVMFISSNYTVYEDESGNAIFIKDATHFVVKKSTDGNTTIYGFEKNGSNFKSLNNYSKDITIQYAIQMKENNNVCYLVATRPETNGVVFREKFVKTVSLDLWYLSV